MARAGISPREENVIEVVSSVYEAALQPPSAWTKPIELLRRTLGGSAGKLATIDFEAGVGRSIASVGIDPVLDGRWQREFASGEPWSTAARDALLAGHRDPIATGTEMLPLAELRRSEVYAELLVPMDIEDMVTAKIGFAPPQLTFLSIYRGRRAEPFNRREKALYRTLIHHVSKAYVLQESLLTYRHAVQATADTAPFALFLCDERGRVELYNRAANRLLSDGDAVSIQEGRLAARRDGGALRRANAQAALLGRSTVVPRALHFSIPRRFPRRSLVVQALPVRPNAGQQPLLGFAVTEPRVLVVITDPDTAPPISSEAVGRIFGLTRAEARVATAIAMGRSVAETAGDLGIRANTVRWQIKQVLAKCGVRRQAELVRLIVASTAPVDP